MARSRRKTPIFGIASPPSEKEDKRQANRVLRRRLRETLRVTEEPEILPALREVSSTWLMSKDGKRYLSEAPPAMMRK